MLYNNCNTYIIIIFLLYQCVNTLYYNIMHSTNKINIIK